MNIWKKPISVERMNARSAGTMMEHLGIRFTEVGDDYAKATMPVDHRTRQPLGIMHGGASCVLAETLGSTTANFCVDESHYCVGLSIYTSHIRSVKSGEVTAMATAIHLGRSTQVWNIDIKNEEGALVSSTRLTMAVLAKA